MVERDHPETGVNQSYLTGSITTNDGGDSVIGLDRFGRAVDQYWGTGTTTTDEFQYGYDKDNNRLYASNVVNGNFSELHHYDNFNQIQDFTRGTLADDKKSVTTVNSLSLHSENWSGDPLGNSAGITPTAYSKTAATTLRTRSTI